MIVNRNGRVRVERIRAAFRDMFARARAEAAAKQRQADRALRRRRRHGHRRHHPRARPQRALAWLLRRGVLRPIRRVAQATETVAAGDLSARVPADRRDELGDLARAFNDMAASLERSHEELARRARELENSNRELEDYASVTSHDLQGPLVTIGMYAELLTQRVEDPRRASSPSTSATARPACAGWCASCSPTRAWSATPAGGSVVPLQDEPPGGAGQPRRPDRRRGRRHQSRRHCRW